MSLAQLYTHLWVSRKYTLIFANIHWYLQIYTCARLMYVARLSTLIYESRANIHSSYLRETHVRGSLRWVYICARLMYVARLDECIFARDSCTWLAYESRANIHWSTSIHTILHPHRSTDLHYTHSAPNCLLSIDTCNPRNKLINQSTKMKLLVDDHLYWPTLNYWICIDAYNPREYINNPIN